MTLAILSAVADEQRGLSEQLKAQKVHELGGRIFRTGQLFGQRVVMARSGIGKVASASTATLLCSHFKAKELIFVGVAGGIRDDIQIGDVVVGDPYVQHDMDASPLFPRWEIPLFGRSELAADPKLHARALAASQKAVQSLGGNTASVHSGLILSGDRFVGDAATRSRIQQEHPAALAAEMEGAAVAQVCVDFGVPFVAVRQVSDRAGTGAASDFIAFVQTHTGPFVQAFFQHLLNRSAS